MNENKTYAKDLRAGDWIVWEGEIYAVRYATVTETGRTYIALSDGRYIDALDYRSFVTA